VQQLKSVRELFRYLPSVQGENIRPQTRGLQAGVVQNTLIDGLDTRVELDGSRYHYVDLGYPGTFAVATGM
jgi:hypothetical protein